MHYNVARNLMKVFNEGLLPEDISPFLSVSHNHFTFKYFIKTEGDFFLHLFNNFSGQVHHPVPDDVVEVCRRLFNYSNAIFSQFNKALLNGFINLNYDTEFIN